MSREPLLDKSRVKIKLAEYGVAPATALRDPGLLPRVQEYRRQTSARMVPLGRDDIAQQIPEAEFHVSRKVDGEFTGLVYRDGEVLTLNPGGTVRLGLPFHAEAAQRLAADNVNEALVAGELYVHCEDRRPRVHDVSRVARQPESATDLQRLRFAVFDIMSIDGQPCGPFEATWQTIERIFSDGERIHPVEAKKLSSATEVETLFGQWVENEGAEGLVVRSDAAGLFKIKPRHTLDVVVIGFTESQAERQGMLHDLLLGIVRQDGTIQVLSRVGGGFSEEDRRTMLSDLKDMAVESEYAEVNADHVAYQMVRPEWVVEISCLDLISQTTRGGPVNRMVLDWRDGESPGYHVVRRLPLAAVISPQFVRKRDDKSPCPDDIRIQQVSERVEVDMADRDARQMTLPASEVLRREVYTKLLKGETMVRKFVMWKSNKESTSDEYPAYVLHYTDFSPNRKDALQREVRVSSSLGQIEVLWDELKSSNIKKGWELYSSEAAEISATSSSTTPGDDTSHDVVKKDAKSKAPAKKKTAAKKKMAPSATRKKTRKKTG